MTDLQALYAGICAEPDEDTPRLALADFLEELDGIENRFRADLIRTHCRLARVEPWSAEWRELRNHWTGLRNTAMLLASKGELPWVAHLKTRVKAWDFERGLIGHLTLFAKRFVADGNAYFEQDPIRSVKFVTLASNLGSVPPEVLFACEHLARVVKLDFDGSQLTDNSLKKLAASRHVSGVRWLGLGGYNSFSPAALPKLLKAMPAVTELSVSGNREFDSDNVKALARCPEFARVTALDLDMTSVGAEGVTALAASPHAGALASLRLTREPVYDEEHNAIAERAAGVAVAAALAASKSLGNLRTLDLSYRDIGGDGLKLIAGAAKSLPALRELNLSGCGLAFDAATALAKSALGPRLRYLNLQFNSPLSRHAKKLAAMFPAAYIEEPFEHVSE